MDTKPDLLTPLCFLKTLGTLSLECPRGNPVGTLRKKDLALLAYLVVDERRRHSRSLLAGMLWGDAPEERARHSLSQAVGRLQREVPGTVVTSGGFVEMRGGVDCDALALRDPPRAGAAAPEYSGDFLAGFAPGPGAEAFEEWADGVRAALRNIVVQRLDAAAADAEGREDWPAALAHAQRAVAVDPCREQAHRRIMRAWRALGEAPRALEHFEQHQAWLRRELGASSDPETAQLADEIRRGTPVPGTVPPPVKYEPAAPPRTAPEPAVQRGPAAVRPVAGWRRARPVAAGAAVVVCVSVVVVGSGLVGALRGRQAGGGCAPGEPVAQFAGETFPDNVPVAPGERFVKQWTVRNTGRCVWTRDFTFQFESADAPLALARRRIPIAREVAPGDTLLITLPMRAPTRPGVYREHWSLRDAEQAIVPVSSSNTIWTRIIVPPSDVPLCRAENAVAKFAGESHPDDTALTAGQTFVKRWTFRNGGNCAWEPGFTLRYSTSPGGRLADSTQVRLNRRVPPGATHDFHVLMRVPQHPGTYQEDWSFHDVRGDTIRVSGSRTVWTRIVAERP